MNEQFKTVLVSSTVHIDTARIPRHVGQNIAQIALRAIRRDYANPAIYEDFLRWKQERAAQAAEAGGGVDE